MTITRPLNEGESQTIRIPIEYRFEDEDLVINRVGDSLMITPRRALESAFFSGAAMLDEDFMADGRPDEVPTVREGLD